MCDPSAFAVQGDPEAAEVVFESEVKVVSLGMLSHCSCNRFTTKTAAISAGKPHIAVALWQLLGKHPGAWNRAHSVLLAHPPLLCCRP